MSKRRHLREAVIKFLYCWEINKEPINDLDRSIDLVWQAFEMPDDTEGKIFCKSLIIGVLQNIKTIDEKITTQLENWELGRLHKVDLTILRLAVYEFFYRPDIPPVVTINEAIDLAKSFSNEESGKFINGILDKIATKLGRSLRNPVE